MPGPYTLSPSHTRGESQNSCVDSTRRYSLAPETTGRQLIDSDAHETRKRSRHGDNAAASPWSDYPLTNTRRTDNKSPPPLANDRYELAGGMDGPQTFARRDGDYDDYFNLQSQRGTWSVPATPQVGLATQPTAGEMQMTPNGSKAWSFMSLVGGVAGKLFEFCTVPFRGFQAGGGQKYNIDSHGEVAAKLGLQDDPYQPGPVQQPTPGTYPSDDYGVQSIDSITPERPRLAKRLRTTDNWIMVGQDCEMESRPGTPRLSERRLPGHGRSPSQIPRPVSRANPGTPSQKRPSLIPVSRRSTVDRRSFHSSNPGYSPGTPASSRSYNRHSFGSPGLFERNTSSFASPLPQESQRLIDKVRKEELEEDERLRRMSLQMTAMLKEANEALGSKFEVEMFDDDD